MGERTVFAGILALWISLAPQTAPAARAAAAEDARAHLGAGLRLFDLQRYSEAAREFKLALEMDPKLEEARYPLAVSEFNQRQYLESRQQFERLLAAGYEKDWVTYYLGRLDLQEGNLDQAIQGFQSLKRAVPLEDELYYLGSAYLKKGEPEKALAPLERQVEFNARDFRAHQLLARAYAKLGRPEAAEREYAEAARLHDYYSHGKQELMGCRNELEGGRADQAWARCGSVLESDDIDKLVAVGMLFGEFGAPDRALRAFEKALALDPDSPEVNYDMGFACYGQKNYVRARTYLETAVKLRPNFFEALALEGTVLYLLGEDAAAMKALRRAHDLRPEDSAVNKLLAQLEGSTK